MERLFITITEDKMKKFKELFNDVKAVADFDIFVNGQELKKNKDFFKIESARTDGCNNQNTDRPLLKTKI